MPLTPEQRETIIGEMKQISTALGLSDDQKQRVLAQLARASRTGKRPKFGSAKNDILYMAPDFDAPLEDFKDYM